MRFGLGNCVIVVVIYFLGGGLKNRNHCLRIVAHHLGKPLIEVHQEDHVDVQEVRVHFPVFPQLVPISKELLVNGVGKEQFMTIFSPRPELCAFFWRVSNGYTN